MTVNDSGYGLLQQDQVGVCCNASTTLEVLGVAFSVFVVLFAFLMYVRCLIKRSHARREADTRPGALGRRKVGLNASVINSLPLFAYRRASTMSPDGKDDGAVAAAVSSPKVECTVCLSALEEGEMVRVLPMCDHMFHSQCIDLWLSSNLTCPVCRTDCDARNLAEKVKVLAASPSIV